MASYRINENTEDKPHLNDGKKASFHVKFIKSDGTESEIQYYEVDLSQFAGETDNDKIAAALQLAADEFEAKQ